MAWSMNLTMWVKLDSLAGWFVDEMTTVGSKTSFTVYMIASSNGSIFRVTCLLWWETTGHRWIPLTKASDAALWCILSSAPEQNVQQTIETPLVWDAHYYVIVMTQRQTSCVVLMKLPRYRVVSPQTFWKILDSKDAWVDIDKKSIRQESVGLMSNRCRSEGFCSMGCRLISDPKSLAMHIAKFIQLLEKKHFDKCNHAKLRQWLFRNCFWCVDNWPIFPNLYVLSPM